MRSISRQTWYRFEVSRFFFSQVPFFPIPWVPIRSLFSQKTVVPIWSLCRKAWPAATLDLVELYLAVTNLKKLVTDQFKKRIGHWPILNSKLISDQFRSSNSSFSGLDQSQQVKDTRSFLQNWNILSKTLSQMNTFKTRGTETCNCN